MVSRSDLALLPDGALVIDVAIGQGGAFETSQPTTYADPSYEVDGVRHCRDANMPGGVPQTATRARTNATFPYLRCRANLGPKQAVVADAALMLGVNTRSGVIGHAGVAEALPHLPHALI